MGTDRLTGATVILSCLENRNHERQLCVCSVFNEALANDAVLRMYIVAPENKNIHPVTILSCGGNAIGKVYKIINPVFSEINRLPVLLTAGLNVVTTEIETKFYSDRDSGTLSPAFFTTPIYGGSGPFRTGASSPSGIEAIHNNGETLYIEIINKSGFTSMAQIVYAFHTVPREESLNIYLENENFDFSKGAGRF